jgi:hypothetical protein
MMAFPLFRWRTGVLAVAMAVLAPLVMGCHKSSKDSTASTVAHTLSGKVTYSKPALLADATTGVPTGLSASLTTALPVRGILVRAFYKQEETALDGTVYATWVSTMKDSQGYARDLVTHTDADGAYSFSDIPDGVEIFVEAVSESRTFDSSQQLTGTVKVLAEPDGVASPTPEPNRLLYAMRKGVDGSAPVGNKTPGTSMKADATVNFDIGLNDAWWLTPSLSRWTQDLLNDSRIVQESTLPAGSRVMAILDSVYTFANVFGGAAPSTIALDLHYCRGIDYTGMVYEMPVGVKTVFPGSFVDYQKSTYPTRYPQAMDDSISGDGGSTYGTGYHFFGGINGDDAFDEGILFPIFAKNSLISAGVTNLPVIKARLVGDASYRQDLQDLRSDEALMEGFSLAVAADLLKSPYLADTDGVLGGGLKGTHPIQDISLKNLGSLKRDPFSAPAIAALGWEVILASNSLASSATPSEWASMKASAAARFFTPTPSYANGSTTMVTDIPNVFHQLGRLQEAQSSTDSVDLQTIFTDAKIKSLVSPFQIPWPRPTNSTTANNPYTRFVSSWGTDPNSLTTVLPSMVLSMEYAHLDRVGQYPGVSWGVDDPLQPTVAKGEVYTSVITMSKDAVYSLSLNTSPAIPPGAQIQLTIGPPNTTGSATAAAFSNGTTYAFGSGSDAQIYQVALGGAGIGSSKYPRFYFPIQVRLVSPDVKQASDILVTVNLTPIR